MCPLVNQEDFQKVMTNEKVEIAVFNIDEKYYGI
jgi:hypothetical protein